MRIHPDMGCISPDEITSLILEGKMKKIKYVTIDGKKWQVVNKTFDINEIIKNSEEKISKEWQAQNDFVAMLAGFMPKLETNTEYGRINPTAWGEEIL